MAKTFSTEAIEGRYAFTIDEQTGELLVDPAHEMRMSGFTPHQVRALAEFYERVTGDVVRREDFGIGEARDRIGDFQKRGWILKERTEWPGWPLPYEAD